MTLKEALVNGYCSLEDEFDFNDTLEGEEITCLRLEIERLNNIINKLEKYLKERSDLDYEGSITILHERLAMNMTLEYLQELKGNNK